MVTASQVEARLKAAETDQDYAEVVQWLTDNGFPPTIAAEHVAVYRLASTGQRLPDTPSNAAEPG